MYLLATHTVVLLSQTRKYNVTLLINVSCSISKFSSVVVMITTFCNLAAPGLDASCFIIMFLRCISKLDILRLHRELLVWDENMILVWTVSIYLNWIGPLGRFSLLFVMSVTWCMFVCTDFLHEIYLLQLCVGTHCKTRPRWSDAISWIKI